MVTKKASKQVAKKAAKKKAVKKKVAAKKKTPLEEAGLVPGGADAKKAVSRDDGKDKQKAALKKALKRSRNYAASGLAAQVTETLIDEIRALDKPWHQIPEAQQTVAIARLSDRVANAMSQAVSILAARGNKAVICNLFSVTFKDGVRGIITVAPGSDMRHELADYATKDCVLVLADPHVFLEGLADLKPDADQPRLI
ncbi:MAG: hypothetical protein V3S33_03485 [Gammaproteobacteria bacterium]